MKNDTYNALRRTAAKVYQANTEKLALLNKRLEAFPDDAEALAKRRQIVEVVSVVNRNKGKRLDKFEYEGRGLLDGSHVFVTRRDPGYIIPSMSCLRPSENS